MGWPVWALAWTAQKNLRTSAWEGVNMVRVSHALAGLHGDAKASLSRILGLGSALCGLLGRQQP
jgi:hypothetical protein